VKGYCYGTEKDWWVDDGIYASERLVAATALAIEWGVQWNGATKAIGCIFCKEVGCFRKYFLL